MTPKRKLKASQRKRQKSAPRAPQDQYAGLRNKLAQKPFHVGGLIVEPPDRVKMSKVLADFVEPYLEFADSDEAYRKLLALAIVAWNSSFLPEAEQHAAITSLFSAGISDETGELQAGLTDIVHTLIERKRRYFAQYQRRIIEYELIDTGPGYHLNVVSTLE